MKATGYSEVTTSGGLESSAWYLAFQCAFCPAIKDCATRRLNTAFDSAIASSQGTLIEKAPVGLFLSMCPYSCVGIVVGVVAVVGIVVGVFVVDKPDGSYNQTLW